MAFNKRRKTNGGGSSVAGAGRRKVEASKGLFEPLNRKWYCDCNPRREAICRPVTKEGKNKGRKFYACQRCQDERDSCCKFFLFEDEALKLRDEVLARDAALSTIPATPAPPSAAARAGGSSSKTGVSKQQVPTTPSKTRQTYLTTTTVPPQPRTPSTQRAGRGVPAMPLAPPPPTRNDDEDDHGEVFSSISTGAQIDLDEARERDKETRASAKRKRSVDEFDDDDDSDVERQMVELADSVSRSAASKNRGVAAEAPATPSRQTRSHHQQMGTGGLPTPMTRTEKRVRLSTPTGGINLPTSTPTPRSTTASSSTLPRSSGEADDDYELTKQVMGLMDRHRQKPARAAAATSAAGDAELRSGLRQFLNNWALRAEGVKKSRDMVRDVVATRDARIAELQERVAHLENARRTDRDSIKSLREVMQRLEEQHQED